MSKVLGFILLFYPIKTNEGTVSNEIFSILPDVVSDIVILPKGPRNTSLVAFPNHKSIDSVRFSNKSLLRIPLLDSNVSYCLICFPSSDEDYKDVYTLSHITCRTMGFMTFASIRAKMSPLNRPRIQPKNLNCSGLRRGTSSCRLLQAATDNCRMVTEVTCGACNGTSKGFKGVIKSPGFPFASFDDVTCEWNVMVPEHHDIILSFNQFDAIDVKSADLPCGLHRPYVHIMYGIQSKVTIHRYCQLSELKNLSIPYHSVKIIVFTGLQGRQERSIFKKQLGISITFEAIVPSEINYGSPLKMLALFLLGVIFIACIILCHYIQKHKLCDCIVKDRDRRILGHPMEQAYDLHNYNRTRTENENLNKGSNQESAKTEFQRNPKMVYESGKDINEYSSLLDSAAGYIPSVTPRDTEDDKEKLNVNLHKKLNLIHSYHGQEDPNRLFVTPPTNYYDYPTFMVSRNASSESCMEEEKKRLKISKSTC